MLMLKQKYFEENVRALGYGDVKSIPPVFCALAEGQAQTKRIAAKALNGILSTLQFDDVVRVDKQMRETSSMEWFINWRRVKIDDLLDDSMSANERRAIVIFASFNPNGFIREQAVKMLSDYYMSLHFIILRLNDWVTQVRLASAAAYKKRLVNLTAGELTAAMPYADKLRLCERDSHNENVRLFFDILASRKYEKELTAAYRART